MLNGIIIGIVIGLIFGWRLHAWWAKSSIKKAAGVVGSATQGPSKVAKGLIDKLKGLFSGNPNDKKEK